MKNLKRTQKPIRTRKVKTLRKGIPISAVLTVALLFATGLTILALQQQQNFFSKAQTEPQQECKADAPLTEEQAGKIEQFCTQFPDAEICKDLCTRTDTNKNKLALCQPGGAYHCEAATGQPEKGKCQQGACTTSTRTGADSYCGGGGTCCEPPHPAGGTCASGDKKECVAGLECINNTCTVPPPPPAPDGGGAPAPDGGGAPAPGGGGAPAPKETCASVKGTCKDRSACTGTVRTGLCPGGANNICCIGGGSGPAKKLPNGSRCTTHNQCSSGYCQDTSSGSGGLGGTCRARGCTSDAQCKSQNATYVCQNGACKAPAKKLNGATCSNNAECVSNRCSIWGGDTVKRCGPIKAI